MTGHQLKEQKKSKMWWIKEPENYEIVILNQL